MSRKITNSELYRRVHRRKKAHNGQLKGHKGESQDYIQARGLFVEQEVGKNKEAALKHLIMNHKLWYLTCDFLASNAVPASCLVPPYAIRQCLVNQEQVNKRQTSQ
jgi:hypothetical protein